MRGMGFFKKAKKNTGWMAIVFQKDAVCMAHVQRITGAQPVIELAKSFPGAVASDIDGFAKIVKEVQLERYALTTLLAGTEYQLLSVDAPNVPPDELKIAIRWKLKDMLDFHIEDATVDVLDVPVDPNAPVRNKSMYAIAAKNQLIKDRQTLFDEVKAPVTVIDIPEMAQRNIAALVEPEGRGVAFLSFDWEGGLLTVTYNGELFLSRRIDVTLKQMQDATGDQKTSYYDRITLELQRSLDHFDRQYHFITLAKLVLGPMGEVASGLKEYLGSNLYVPVEALDLNDVLDFTKVPDIAASDMQAQYFMAIGAALRLEEKML
jgi:MSHA biogenesis protein MshI